MTKAGAPGAVDGRCRMRVTALQGKGPKNGGQASMLAFSHFSRDGFFRPRSPPSSVHFWKLAFAENFSSVGKPPKTYHQLERKLHRPALASSPSTSHCRTTAFRKHPKSRQSGQALSSPSGLAWGRQGWVKRSEKGRKREVCKHRNVGAPLSFVYFPVFSFQHGGMTFRRIDEPGVSSHFSFANIPTRFYLSASFPFRESFFSLYPCPFFLFSSSSSASP